MARYNIDEIINNANSQKKKKKRYDIDEILNNANNISKSSSITKTNISTPNIRLNNEDKNFWGNVGNMSNKMLQEAIKVEEQRNFAKELLKNSISNVKNINLGDGFVKASSAFDDGYQFGDVSKTILSTTGDVALNVGKGIMNIGEGIGDLATYGIAGIADLTGNDEYADKLRYNASNMNVVDDLTKPVSDFVDKNSVLGDKADEIAQGLGYVAGNTAMSILTGGLGAKLGISSKIAQTAGSMGTTFSSSMGHGMSEAYQNGATDDEAFAYGIISAAGETGSELMFGGLGKASKAVGLSKGAGELDDIVIGGLTKNIKNKMAKTLVQSGLKAGGEGAEEVVSGLISAVGKKLTYMSEEELGQILKDENLAEQFWMGALTSAIAQSPSTISSIKNRTDYITGEKYNDIQKNNAPELAQNHQNNERQQTILNDIKMPQNQNKPQLDDMLNNKELPMQKYVYEKSNNIKINNLRQDANKYFNNSEKAHNYMQMLEKIIEDKNIDIRLDANLKTPDGRTANGSYSNGVMTINPNSAKAGEFIAVHELTHAIGTKDMLNIVENYRKNNKEFNSEVERLLQNYNSTEITEEALSDVSAQLFGNQEFINNIAQNNPNIFQKIYSEIKYLWHQFRGYKNQDQFVEDLYYKWTQAYNSNNKLNNTTSYHISKNLSNDIDNVLKNINERNPVRLRDYTPSVLVNNGIKNLPMYENPAHIRKNILTESEARKAGLSINTRDHYHGLGKEVYIKAIDSLDKPRVIFKNNTNNEYLILTVIKDKNNNNVIVPIEIETNTKVNNVTIDINRVKTVYGYKEQNNIDLNDYIKHNIKKNKFAKIYEQKKEKGTGFSTVANSNTSIPSSNKDVNTTTKYSIQKNENNSKWQQYLDKNFKSTGTRTNLEDVRQIAPYKNDKNVSDSKAKIAPTKTGIDTMETNKTGQKETNIDRFNKYKRNIVKASEETINNLISYKNVTARSIDNKIAEKQRILNSKKNKDTKLANTIKSQIENLKLQKTEIENLYNEKIDKFNSKISKEKIELEVRNKMKQEARKALNAEIEPLIKDLTQYKDKKRGILYNRETPQRNIYDTVKNKDLASAINQTIFDPVQVDEAKKTRKKKELRKKIKDLDLDKKKKYYYVPENEIVGIKVDEATLAQFIIEKKITDTNLRNYGIDDVGIEKIHKTADTFTEILNYLYNKMNDKQIEYGYSPIGKIENYFPHFSENRPDTLLGKVASYFGIDLTKQNLPTEIAGKTDTFKPGRTWNSNIQKRRTNKTDYDALTAMEKYIDGATDLIYMTDSIQKVREYARQIRYKYSDKGIQSEIDKIMNDGKLTQEAKDFALEGIFENTESELSNFVTWLDDYANTLAGKKAFSDRNMERNMGRDMYNSMSGIESRIAANTIGGNLSVSLTNFAPIFQAAGTTKWNYLLTGLLQTASNDIKGMVGKSKDISFVTNSNFLTNRFGVDSIARKKISQKISDIASIPMNAIDKFTSESIVRAKYLENIDKGMTEEKALDSADKYAAKIMADRSKGALPIIFNAKNPFAKLLTMFQVEPNNMISNYFKDMPRDAESKSQLIRQARNLMIASWAGNTVIMALRGGNEVAPDPIRWVSYLIKAITGDDDEKEKAKTDLAESVLGSIPFLNNLAGFVGVEDIGRIPISNAMPNITNLWKLTDGDADSKYKLEIAVKEFSKPLIYLGLPVGGAQIKKTIEGIATVSNGGSYRTNKDGEKELQFPVENPNIGDYIKAGIFGKYSLSDSKAYADRGYKTLSAKQTKMYEEANIPYRELLDYLDAGLKKTEDKIEYISSKKMNTNQKWGIYTNDIFSKTERNDGGSQLSDAKYITSNGVSKKDFIEIYNKAQEHNIDIPTADEYKEMQNNEISLEKYMDYQVQVKQITNQKRNNGELSETQSLKSKDKIQILLDSSYSNKEIKAIYENYIKSENDSEYSIMNKTGIKIKEYLKYKQQDFSSDSTDDGTIKGKTVSGSSKVKTYEYVNKMNITYEQRLMLLGMKYTLTDTEQTRLYNYVKSLNCTTEEKQDILEKLKGFTVYKNGRVTW